MKKVYLLTGIAPPNIYRRVITNLEKFKQTNDKKHPMFGSDMPIFALSQGKAS